MLRYLWVDVVELLASCKVRSGRQPNFSTRPKSVPSTHVRTQLAYGRTQASLSVPNASGSAVWTAEKKNCTFRWKLHLTVQLFKSAYDGGVRFSGQVTLCVP
jgi:hypothetical protein